MTACRSCREWQERGLYRFDAVHLIAEVDSEKHRLEARRQQRHVTDRQHEEIGAAEVLLLVAEWLQVSQLPVRHEVR